MAGESESKIRLGAGHHRARGLDWAEVNLFTVCALLGTGSRQGGFSGNAQPGEGCGQLGSRGRDSGLNSTFNDSRSPWPAPCPSLGLPFSH